MKKYIGVDIGGTKCSIALSTEQGQILTKSVFFTADYATTLTEIKAAVSRFAASSSSIICGGISCGGPLDVQRGRILSPPNLRGWDDVAIVDSLAECSELPFALENDANACALAEWRFGGGQGSQNMIFLTFGTGMGAGIIVDGRLLHGANGHSGEVGHLRLQRDGNAPVGFCKQGSFEGFCSGGGIAQYIPQELKSAGITTAKDLAESATQSTSPHNRLAQETFQEIGVWLGRGIALLIDILNPEIIVVGSIFMRCEDLLRPSMELALQEEALPKSLAACRIVPSQLQENVGDIAALGVALELEKKLPIQ